MLVLSRKPGESILVDGPCRVTVYKSACRLGIEGDAKVLRGELAESDRQSRAQRKTIHLVDDSVDILRATEKYLTYEGFNVEAFSNGKEYLQHVQSQRDACGAVLDLRLAEDDVDGLGILQQLRDWKQDFPVIMLTGYGDVDTCRQAFHSGCYTFLQKPVPPSHLANTLRQASEQYLNGDLKRSQSVGALAG